jgi:hypothetical protein
MGTFVNYVTRNLAYLTPLCPPPPSPLRNAKPNKWHLQCTVQSQITEFNQIKKPSIKANIYIFIK